MTALRVELYFDNDSDPDDLDEVDDNSDRAEPGVQI